MNEWINQSSVAKTAHLPLKKIIIDKKSFWKVRNHEPPYDP